MALPTAELSSQGTFVVAPALSEGFGRAWMARMRRAGQGMHDGCIIGRFDEVVIAGCCDCNSSPQDNLLAKRIKNGLLGG